MENLFRRESLKFDGTNYENWKDKIKTHLLCMGLGYWIVAKESKNIAKEDNLETCIEERREAFM